MSSKKKSPCPPLHRRYPTTGKCELIKVYQLKRKSNDKTSEDYFVRLMPQSLKDILSDEVFQNEYVINKDNSKIEIYQDRLAKNKTVKLQTEKKFDNKEKIIIRRPKIKILPLKGETVKNKQKIKIKNRSKVQYTDYLYPNLEDSEFSAKLTKHKQFNDTQYDGNIYNIEEKSNYYCNLEFELTPHQNFVKNFLSSNTPYNSLLLYHGLGSGKTCSAIGVAEEARNYMKQIGILKKIIIIASPNVQDNFKLQLFDERKLKYENGMWNINSCVGNNLLNEINPTSLKDIPKSKIVSQIKSLINKFYKFMGYTQFANFVTDNTSVQEYEKEKRERIKIKKINALFDNRTIVIDEVHNIRIADDNKDGNKKCAELLMEIVKKGNNIRLLLLSATPMYNSHEEIIWLTNLMNLNDNRSTIRMSDIFDANGLFINEKDKGEELLKRKLTGYISYIRGENPYLFPVRIYADNNDWSSNKLIKMPTNQLNGKKISKPMEHIQDMIFFNSIGDYQKKGYTFILQTIRKNYKEIFLKISDKNNTDYKSNDVLFDAMDTFGYLILQKLVEALNIVYPTFDFKNESDNVYAMESLVGKTGLNQIMRYKTHDWTKGEPYYLNYNFDYINNNYGNIFSESELYKYSAKMAKICEIIKKSEGIILIYSQYIDGGAVPMGLALEEMGFTRFGTESYTKPLFKAREDPIEPIDSITMEKKSNYSGNNFEQAKYMMITGDKTYSPANDNDIKYLNDPSNKYGKNVKVVIISRAAGEGIDFKNIRQIHILEPWFNLNRIEQIIGRGVRNLSHCGLPFNERNVEIFLHGTLLPNSEEATDLYIYRLAEQKSIKIGRITRLMKEIAVDCLLNIGQNNFTMENLLKNVENENIEFKMPSGDFKQINLGDKPYTDICDYMDNCNFTCNNLKSDDNIIMTTYNDSFIVMNNDTITKRIKDIFKDIPNEKTGKFFIKREELINSVNITKTYPIEEIYNAVNNLIDRNDYLIDKYGRKGFLINKGEYYFFQPQEITDIKASIYERSTPVDSRISSVLINLPEIVIRENKESKEFQLILDNIKNDYNNVFVSPPQKVSFGEKDWFKNYSTIIEHLTQDYNIDIEKLKRYAVIHSIDSLNFSNKIALLNGIYENWNPNDNIEIYIKEYLDKLMVASDKDSNATGFVLSEDNKTFKVYVKNEDFEKAGDTMTEKLLFSSEYKEKFLVDKKSLNKIIGFIAPLSNELMFKTRDLSKTVNKKGAVVMQAQAKDIALQLNEILGEQIYLLDNKEEETKGKTKILNIKNNKKYGKNRMAVVLEILLRYFNETYKNGKVWFLTNEEMIINKIYKYEKKN